MDQETKDTIKEELKTLTALQSVQHLEGVQLLVKQSKNTVVNCINILSRQYFEKSETEIRSLCATLKANLELYQLMTGIDDEILAINEVLNKK